MSNTALRRLFGRMNRGNLGISGGALNEDNPWQIGGANSEDSAAGWKDRTGIMHADTFEKPSNYLQGLFDNNFDGVGAVPLGGGATDEPQKLNTENYEKLKGLLGQIKGQTRGTESAVTDPNVASDEYQSINYGQGRVMDDAPEYRSQNAAAIEQETKPKRRSEQLLDEIGVAEKTRPEKEKPDLSTTSGILDEISRVESTDTPREKSFGKRLGSGLWNGLKAWAASGGQGGLAGALGAVLTGGIGFGASPGAHADFRQEKGVNKLWNKYNQQTAAEQQQSGLETAAVQRQNIIDDNTRQKEQFKQTMDYNRAEQQRKVDDRLSRENTARMNAIAAQFRNLPSVDFSDPKNAELKAAMKDVGLPITDKDSKKKIDLKQDQRTGEWTVILTDPVSGKQEVRPVIKDGKPFKSTPTVVMQGEYGMLKQQDQQNFTAEQNAINRKESLRRWAVANQVTRAKFKAALDAKVANGTLTQAQANEAMADFPTDLQ